MAIPAHWGWDNPKVQPRFIIALLTGTYQQHDNDSRCQLRRRRQNSSPSRSVFESTDKNAFRSPLSNVIDLKTVEVSMVQKHMFLCVLLLGIWNEDACTHLLKNGWSLMVNGSEWSIVGSTPPHSKITIHWAPLHLKNAILEKFLSKYGEVAGIKMNRCYIKGDKIWNKVHNGIRSAWVSFTSKDEQIPNFVQFGRNTVMFSYAGQDKTCRRCAQPKNLAKLILWNRRVSQGLIRPHHGLIVSTVGSVIMTRLWVSNCPQRPHKALTVHLPNREIVTRSKDTSFCRSLAKILDIKEEVFIFQKHFSRGVFVHVSSLASKTKYGLWTPPPPTRCMSKCTGHQPGWKSKL